MSQKDSFIQEMQSRYSYKNDKIVLGKAKFEGEIVEEVEIAIALKTMNRHGLIGGATGTGKTKSLQIIAEQLSLKSVPTLLMDIKGDLSGIGAAANASDKNAVDRMSALNLPFDPQASPVELLSISGEPGVRLRATVEDFGPILFSKILELNETQESIISIIFKYCEDKKLPLIDLEDIRRVLQYVTDSAVGKEELNSNYGTIAPASLGAILRKIVGLEQQGASKFFGEPSFDVQDLLKIEDGKGIVNIIRLVDIQNQPNLFSTFMLSLLNKIYSEFPEAGDSDKPKLVIFIDEAHLIFKEATKALLSQIETMVKLIRSKGVGLYFVTQVPGDVPDAVLSQLGLKIQHALRGFTAKDRKEITKAIENYPTTTYYKADEVITQLGIGEAFVTALDEKGIPTPLAYTYMRAPNSRMDVLTNEEINSIVSNSSLVKKYDQNIDRQTANEILSQELEQQKNIEKPVSRTTSSRSAPREQDWTDNKMVRDVSRTATRKLIDWGMKILMNVLKGKKIRQVYAILDIEATGGKVGEESVIEIAVYKYDGKEIVDQFISLVNPERKIDYYVQKLTHITDKMVRTAPKFHEIAKRIVEITDDCILVGHNVMFDYRMLRQEFERLGYNFEKEWIDTFEYSEKLIPNLPSYSLGKLCESLGIIVTDRHRASGDARATVSLFKMLLDKDTEKIISKKTGLQQPKKTHSKYQKLLDNLPNSVGVFYLYNSRKQLIYISRSNNIAQTINHIFTSKTLKANKLKRYTRSIKFEETGSGFLAAIKENNEVLKNQPMYNNRLVENKVYPYGLYYLESKRGYSRLEIGKLRKVEPVLKFKTKERAKEVLEKILHDYQLCLQVNAGIKSEESCFQYKVNECNGACIKEEAKEVYNQRIEDFIKTTEYPAPTFLILDKGRKGIEKSFYLIEDNQFKGYGYFEYHHQIKTLEMINHILIPIEETDEIKNMLKYFLYKTSSHQNQIVIL